MFDSQKNINQAQWKKILYEVIFEADTQGGKLFDIALFISITLSLLVVMLESVQHIQLRYGYYLSIAEWFLTILFNIGSLMYLIEGPENGFTSIPISIYWAIVTLTTVGYGDIAPKTTPGQILASVVMILGYAIIAVPTGIVTVELSEAAKKAKHSAQVCPNCIKEGHEVDAIYCKYCSSKLN